MNAPDLPALRQRIDTLDDQIIDLLGQRFAVTRQVGEWKAEHGAQAVDADRERQQLERFTRLAKANQLDADLVCGLFRQVIDAVVQEHREIAERQARSGDAT
jgi:chorismate mutase